MAIHIVYGKPGSGKSRYATGKLIQELRETRRYIITNLPLNIPRLSEYLQQAYPNDTIDLGRIVTLDDENLRMFFLWRGPSVVSSLGLPPPRPSISDEMPQAEVDAVLKAHSEAVQQYDKALAKAKGDIGQMLLTADDVEPFKGADRGRGVAFFIDEAQIPFNARDWAEKGMRSVFEYLTQHRKLGDEVWAMTQSPGNLDKQFRSLAQDFRKLRNDRLIKLGVFRGFDRFTCRHYDLEPSGKQEPFFTEHFPLDAEGVGSCYDTARGIGVQGNKADIGARAKGLTIGWAAAAVVALSLSILAVPKILAMIFLDGKNITKTEQHPVVKEVVSVPISSAQKKPAVNPEASVRAPSGVPTRRLLGVTVRGRSVRVLWSDGTVTTERDKALESVESGLVVYDGVAYPLWSSTQSPTPREKPLPVAEVQAQVPVPEETGEWKTDKDGVQRLKNPPTLATMGQTSLRTRVGD